MSAARYVLAWLLWGCAAAPPAVAPVSATDPTHGGETYHYCAGGTVTEFEIHRCVLRVSPAEQRRRGFGQRLVWQGQRQVRYDELNGLGVLINGESRVGTYEYEYENERLVGYSKRSRNGVLRGKNQFSRDLSWVRYLDEQGRPLVNKDTRVSGLKRRLDQRGRVIEYTYVDAAGNPTPSVDGRIVVRPKRDARGALYEESYFDAAGQAMLDGEGVHRRTWEIDARGFQVAESAYGLGGYVVLDKHGVSRCEYAYDDAGNWIQSRFYGLSGEPVRSSEHEAAGFRVVLDERGSELEREFFDVSGRLVVGKYGYALRKRVNDQAGDAIQWSLFGVDGRPMRNKSHHIMRIVRDARGNSVLERFFDEAGLPIANERGAFAIRMEYDERDNLAKWTYLDAAGQPTLSSKYFATGVSEYDGDRLIAQHYLDPQGQLVDRGSGHARFTQAYDEMGAPGPYSYFDARGRAVLPVDSCKRRRHESGLQMVLAPLLACKHAAGDVAKVYVSAQHQQGRLSSAAYAGRPVDALTNCLDDALSQVVLEGSGASCQWLELAVDFAEPAVEIGAHAP